MSTRDVLSDSKADEKGVRINVVTTSPTNISSPSFRSSFVTHGGALSPSSPLASPIRRLSESRQEDRGAQFKEHMDQFAQINRSKQPATLDKLADVGGSARRLSAPMDDVVKVQIDPALALNVSQIAFRLAARQSATAWTNEIVNRLNVKYSFGLDPVDYWLVDVRGVPLEKPDALFDGAGLKDAILALAARHNKEETAERLRAIEKAASAVRAAKALKAEKQKEMQIVQNHNAALLHDVKKTVKDKEEAEKAAHLEAKRAALAAERKAAKESGEEESRTRAISRMATVTFDALKTSIIRQGRHVRGGSKVMFQTTTQKPPVLTVDWTLVSAKMPTGKDAESNKLREQLFKLFDTTRTGKLTLEQTQKGVTDVLLFGGVLPRQVVKLAFAAAAAFNKDGARISAKAKRMSVTGKKTAVVVDWVRFRMLLVYLRQYLELFVLFDTINVARDGKVTESEFVAAQSLLEQYGFKLLDLSSAFQEIKRARIQEGVKFKDFAHWGLNKNLRLEEHDTRRSEMVDEKSVEAKEEEAKAQAAKVLQFKELMDAKARGLKTGTLATRPNRNWGKNTLERALSSPVGISEGEIISSDTTIFIPLPSETPHDKVPEISDTHQSPAAEGVALVKRDETELLQQPLIRERQQSQSKQLQQPQPQQQQQPEEQPEEVDVEIDEDDDENIEAEKKVLMAEEPERLAEYAQIEWDVVENPNKKLAKGILLNGPSVHKSKLQVTDEVKYMPNCMYEQEELEYEQEEVERAKELESSDDEDEVADPLPSFVKIEVPEVPCEVCVESHAAVSRCVQCEENMCLKLASAHQKSKIGREHTLIPVQVESKGDYCEVCEEAHAMDMKCVECDEVMCQKVAGAHKRSKIGREHTVIPLEPTEEEVEDGEEVEEKYEEEKLEAEIQSPASQTQQDLTAFKAMMDAKVQNYRAGHAIAVIPTGTRLRVTARTWGTGANSPTSPSALSPLSPASSSSTS